MVLNSGLSRDFRDSWPIVVLQVGDNQYCPSVAKIDRFLALVFALKAVNDQHNWNDMNNWN